MYNKSTNQYFALVPFHVHRINEHVLHFVVFTKNPIFWRFSKKKQQQKTTNHIYITEEQ